MLFRKQNTVHFPSSDTEGDRKRRFRECRDLKSVEFSEGLEKIDLMAFFETGLENVTLPASLRVLAQAAFAKCSSLRTAKFREGLETLGTEELQENGKPHYGVFAESALEYVRLPSTLKLIEYGAFESCGNLRAINLPEKLEHVGKLCFWGSALESVRLPPALKTVEESAFDQCKGLKSVEFPDALEKICANAFFMSGIEKADFPASLKTVDQSAFAGCENLRRVSLPEGLECIGRQCF